MAGVQDRNGRVIIKNATAHPVRVLKQDGYVTSFPPSGFVVRVREVRTPVLTLDGVVVERVSFQPLTPVPPREEGVIWIVSRMVRYAYPDRMDFVSPARPMKDGHGSIFASQSLETDGDDEDE